MEFNRAKERGIPILLFFMHKDHPIKAGQMEIGEIPQRKLAEFKERASKERGCREFDSPERLCSEVLMLFPVSSNAIWNLQSSLRPSGCNLRVRSHQGPGLPWKVERKRGYKQRANRTPAYGPGLERKVRYDDYRHTNTSGTRKVHWSA